MKYFAYGSNCSPEIMQKKGVVFTDRSRATLSGYKLYFNKKALKEQLPEDVGFANIEPAAEGTVEGVLYDIVEDHLELLDRSERYPDHYDRISVTVEANQDRVECFSYKARPEKTAEGLKPSRDYLNHILAARDFLSRQYYEALNASLTYKADCYVCHRSSEVVFTRELERLYMLCQPCQEARLRWSEVRGRVLTIAETEAIMAELGKDRPEFTSPRALIDAAIEARMIDPSSP